MTIHTLEEDLPSPPHSFDELDEILRLDVVLLTDGRQETCKNLGIGSRNIESVEGRIAGRGNVECQVLLASPNWDCKGVYEGLNSAGDHE
jgi:hypothetical protein